MAVAERALTRVVPYHLFRYRDVPFVFDTTYGRFFKIDDLTHEFLDLCRELSVDEVAERLISTGAYDSDTVADVAREVEYLATQGLFDSPDYSLSDDEIEAQLEARYDAPWNKLELALAETCNLSCTYCYCKTCRDMPDQGLMSETVARQAVTWLFAMSGRSKDVHITFFGGEPLLNKPVFHFVIEYSQSLAKLHGKKVRYSMTTNGTLLDDEVIDQIKRYNFGLMVSLDGPPEIHNAQCPFHDGTGSFDVAAEGIKRLMQRRKRVTVRCTMTHSGPPMKDLIDFFEDFGFSRIVLGRTVNPVRPSPVDCTTEDFASLAQQEEELIDWMLEQLDAGEQPKYFPYGEFMRSHNSNRDKPFHPSLFKCGACRGTTTVGADGRLYPCHRFVGMEAFVVGDVTDGPDLEKCKQFWRDYYGAIREKCLGCWAFPLCQGPCPWDITSELMGMEGKIDDCRARVRFYERATYLASTRKEGVLT